MPDGAVRHGYSGREGSRLCRDDLACRRRSRPDRPEHHRGNRRRGVPPVLGGADASDRAGTDGRAPGRRPHPAQHRRAGPGDQRPQERRFRRVPLGPPGDAAWDQDAVGGVP